MWHLGRVVGTTTPASSETCEYFKKERRQIWGNLSDAAREQFHWDDPGLPFILSSEDVRSTMPPPRPSGGRDVDGRVLPPPDNFLLMLLYPFRVDYLRLTDNYCQVDEWDATGGRGMGTRALHRDGARMTVSVTTTMVTVMAPTLADRCAAGN